MTSLPSIPSWLKQWIPALDWLAHYERQHLPGDALAGVIVATLLIPQAMAYALLAGLPPQVGLYASMLPLAVYALLGSSRFLSVGPSALLSLLILTQIAALAEPGSPRYLAFAMATALIAGVMQISMGAARLGVLTNFLSQPVLSGFTSAAACLIALSQVKHLLGVPLPRTEHLHELLAELARAVPQTHWPTLAISTASIVLLLAFQYLLPQILARWRSFPPGMAQSLSKSGPIVVVIVGTAIVAAFHLGARSGVSIIGEIPSGLPRFALPALASSELLPLIPLAFMAVVGRVGNTAQFLNVRRHEVNTLPHVLLLRIDESLYFANAKYIEDFVLSAAAERPQLRHLVLICNAINFIDASALETLTDIRTRMQDAGIELYLTEVKGPVMDRLADTEFLEQLGHERVFLTTKA